MYIIQKVLLFAFFFGLVSFTADFFIGKASDSLIDASTILSLASYLGFLNAVKIIINFLISSWIAKQVLGFIK